MPKPAVFYHILLVCVLFFNTSTAFAKDVLKLGVLAEYDSEKASVYRLYKPVVDALNAKSFPLDINMEVLNMQEMNSRAENNSIDILISNPIHYTLLLKKYSNLKPLATQIVSLNGLSTFLVGGVIFTRFDRQDINRLEDVYNHTIAIRGKYFWGCFAIPAQELLHAGIKITQLNESVLEFGTTDAVVQAVLKGEADVGMLRTGLLEVLFSEGKLRPSEIKILNEQQPIEFPFITSTVLYPNWPVFAMPHVNESVCKNFARALLGLKLPAHSSGSSIVGFTLPFSYASVTTLLTELEYSGFSPLEFFWNGLLYRHKGQAYVILGSLILICSLILLLGLVLLKINKEKARIKTMLNGMPYPGLLVNEAHRVIAVNEAAKNLFHAREGAYCWEQLWHAEFLPEEQKRQYERLGPDSNMCCIFCEAQRAVTSGKPISRELFINGRYWESWWIPVDSFTFLHYFVDITTHKNRESELEKTHRFLRDIADVVQDMIWVKDVNKHYLFVNKTICEKLLLAKDTEEPIGKTDLFFAERIRAERPDDKTWHTFGELCQDSDNIVISTKKPGRFEEFGNVRGKYLYLDVIKVPCFDENGQLMFVVGSARDITHDKKLQQEKELFEKQIQQSTKIEAVGIMAGGIAHNFNNILQLIIGYAQLLSQRLPAKDEVAERSLNQILQSCERAVVLVRSLMSFSRKDEYVSIELNLNNEVLTVQQILNDTLPKAIKLNIDLEQNLWTIKADAIQLQTVLLNLANNARDAMPEGGVFSMATRNVPVYGRPDKQNASPWLAESDYVLLEVSDTGCGMSEETLKHLGEPFFTKKEMGKGTGLGLFSTYGIVKSLRGHIFVKSVLGKGTTFEIYLPVVRRESLPLMDNAFASAKPTSRNEQPKCKTILLVDDEAGIRMLIRQALESNGYSVLEAKSGENALEIYKSLAEKPEESAVDLVILDLNMPGMSGQVCLQELLKIDNKLKVLVASGYSDNGIKDTVFFLGAVGFLVKPFKLDVLLKKVDELVAA